MSSLTDVALVLGCNHGLAGPPMSPPTEIALALRRITGLGVCR